MSEEIVITEETVENDDLAVKCCQSCGDPVIEEGYSMDLCKSCRTTLSNRPIPVWIKGFSLFIVVILIIALIQFPSTLSTGISYERGQRFEKQNKYWSAEKEYKEVLNRYPNCTTALCQLFIAQYNNLEYEDAYTSLDKIVGQEVDADTVNTINSISDKMYKWFNVSDELSNIVESNKDAQPAALVESLQPYVDSHPEDVSASMALAYAFRSMGDVERCENIMARLCEVNPEYNDAGMFLAAIYRQTGEFDKAESLLQEMINRNVENADAHAAMARIEIKKSNDKKALNEALTAYKINKKSSYVLASLALAYHYNKMPDERDEIYTQFKQLADENQDGEILIEVFNESINRSEI